MTKLPATVIPAPVSEYGAGSERESRWCGAWTPVCRDLCITPVYLLEEAIFSVIPVKTGI